MSAFIFPERDFGDFREPPSLPMGGPLFAPYQLPIFVHPMLPFQSTDPARPGWIHAIHLPRECAKPREPFDDRPRIEFFWPQPERLLVSPQCWAALGRHFFRQKARAWFRRGA